MCLGGIRHFRWQHLLITAPSTGSQVKLSEIVMGFQHRIPVDLIPLPIASRTSDSAYSFAYHMYDLHAEIHYKVALSNETYKSAADLRCKYL